MYCAEGFMLFIQPNIKYISSSHGPHGKSLPVKMSVSTVPVDCPFEKQYSVEEVGRLHSDPSDTVKGNTSKSESEY